MVITYLLFIIGFFLLVKGAHWIVSGSSSIAKKFGVSELMIGLTIVAFGTSLPELFVNIIASFGGASEISFGNIVGVNISNILLILGIAALVADIKVGSSTVWKEIPFAIISSFVFFLLTTKIFFGTGVFFTKNDGLILLAIFAIFIYYVIDMAKRDRSKTKTKLSAKHPIIKTEKSNWKIFYMLIIGFVAVYLGARWVVDGAVFVAEQFGLSEYLIAATIVSIGTSLPELVVSVTAAFRKNSDLAVGNIVGSNIFNLLFIFGVISFIAPLKVPSFIAFNIGIMFFATLLLFAFMFIGSKHKLQKREGIIFLILYVLYVTYLIIMG